MQVTNDILDRPKTLHQLSVAILDPINGQGLFPKDIKDSMRGVTVFNLDSERIIDEVYSRLSSIVVQGHAKNYIRDRRGGEWAAFQRHGVPGDLRG